jgi:uncharacterized protein (UPF0332 family)
MNALAAAHAHLAKAQEFLQAAELEHRPGLDNAATSNAVLSGINSKDAICLKLSGRTTRSDDHAAPVGELAATGTQGRPLAQTLKRLLSKKTKSQYQDHSVAASEARRAIEQATKLYNAAQQIVTS